MLRLRFITLGLLLALTVSVSAVYGAYSCQDLFHPVNQVVDARYGTINQNDPYFQSQNLMIDHNSMLCGPVCVMNVLHKLRPTESKSKVQSLAETENLVRKIFPSIGVPSSQLINEGVKINALAEVMHIKLHEANIKAQVYVKEEISLFDLRMAVTKNYSAIVLLTGHKGINPQYANEANQFGAHYMVVVGYDRLKPNRILFRDPMFPDIVKAATLTQVKPLASSRPTFRVEFEKSIAGGYILIESVLFIQTAKPD